MSNECVGQRYQAFRLDMETELHYYHSMDKSDLEKLVLQRTQELEMQKALLMAVFDSSPDLIFCKNLDLHYTHCNKSFLEYFDLRKEDTIGKTAAEVLNLGDEETRAITEWEQQVIREGRTITREESVQQRVEETVSIIEMVKAPLVFNGAAIGVLSIARDVTKFKKMEEAALAASHSKSAFLANMSHEIRTPMNSIIGFSELALDCSMSPKVKNYLFNILQNSEWLLQIINDILDISKAESGRMEMEKVPFDLDELFASCRTIIMPKIVEKDLRLCFSVEPGMEKNLLGDPTRLRQVFVNLLSNAVKFTSAGSVNVLACVKEKTEHTITVHFEVNDSGIGMTAEQIERIFIPFMQAETGTTRKYGGSGLGLPIAKNIIELMGGELTVRSSVNAGSVFSFELRFDTAEPAGSEANERQIILKDFEKPVFDGEILVCEDNTMNQQVICEHLARVGLNAVVAGNGMTGVEMVKSRMEKPQNKQFGMIFMDIHMPVMDGFEAAAEILKLNAGIPIAAMTADITPEAMEMYRRSGISECVGKPFTSQELWRCLLKYFTPQSWQTVQESRYMQAEHELRQNLMSSFVKDNRNTPARIAEAISAGDVKLAHQLAHNLKSNAGHLGSTALQFAAAAVEQQLKDGKNLIRTEQMTALQSELDAALLQFAAELQDNGSKAAPKTQAPGTDSARELIAKLEPLLETGNPACLELIADLRSIQESCSNPPAIEELIQQMENFDFGQAFVTFCELKTSCA